MSLPKKILLLLLLLITFIAVCVYTKVEQIANELAPQTVQESETQTTQNVVQEAQEPTAPTQEQSNEQTPQEPLTPEEAFKKVDENAVIKEETPALPTQEASTQEIQETQANIEKIVEQNFEEEKKAEISVDESVQSQINKVLENNGILFQRMSAIIAESSKETLENIAKIINDNPASKVEIAGHTDAKGDDKYNQWISEQRALSVKKRLTDLGVEEKRLIAKGYGKTMPLVPNDQDGYSLINRRVEINIIEE
jgi:outer membrane protein OmpA-like peptidoglycan-associated protein